MADTSARIVKAAAARDLNARVAFNFEDLHTQAAAHLKQAREEAASIVDRARREVEAQRQKALEEARQQGRQEGLKSAQETIDRDARQLSDRQVAEQIQTVLPAINRIAADLKNERERWQSRWEQSAVELAIAIAEKLLRSSLQKRPELATGMICEALQLAAGQPELTIRLNPADIERLGPQAADIVKSLTSCARPEFVADTAIVAGGCTIETKHGHVDARLETLLQRIADELLMN